MASVASLGLGSAAGRLKAAAAVQNAIYGPCDPAQVSSWRPRTYADNKSRYLWTDAFGVMNFISLAGQTGDCVYLRQADALIADVHSTLGRTRDGLHRLGAATAEEPTLGGLRIGKALEEGHPDGDGQYFHYLTKQAAAAGAQLGMHHGALSSLKPSSQRDAGGLPGMPLLPHTAGPPPSDPTTHCTPVAFSHRWAFALNRMGLATGEPRYNRWAVQLMEAAHPHFVHGREPHMWWKVSVDLSRPLVPSEGNLDPFDGLVTYTLLREAAGNPSILSNEIQDMERMVERKYRSYSSEDPLDLGEALWLAHWQLPGAPWARLVSERSLSALEELWGEGYFRRSQQWRLAFREFGTTLGVQVNSEAGPEWGPRVDHLHSFWAGCLFTRDADITPVMFAASLLPGAWGKGYGTTLQRLQRAWRGRAQEE